MPLIGSLGATALVLSLGGPPPPPPPPPPPAASADAEATAPTAEVSLGAAHDVLYPELARAANTPQWAYTDGGPALVPYDDTLDKKIQRSAGMVLGGASIAVVGMATIVASLVVRYTGNPDRLEKLENDDGVLPLNSPKRRNIIRNGAALPYLYIGGIGLTVVGAVVAVVGTRRIKKLRQRKKDALSWRLSPGLTGVAAQMEVRF